MGPIGTFPDLRAALWRRLWLILLILAIGLPAVVFYVQSRPRLYEATSVIQIEAPEITVTTAGQVRGVTADGQLDLITQHLMARDSMERMIAEHGLFAALDSDVERVAALRNAITIVKLVDPAQAWRPDVQPTGLSITVRLGAPGDAAAVADALLDTIIAEARERAEGRATRTLAFLVSEEARVSDRIAAVEDRIAGFRTTNIDSLPEGLTAQRDRLNRLTEARLALEQQRIELQGAAGRMRAEEAAAQQALLAGQIDLVEEDIATVEAALAAAPDVERQLTAMQRDLDQLEAELTVLTTQRTEAATAELLATREQVERFTVLERAQVPEFPVSMSRRKLALAGGVAVVLLAGLVALALEIMQPAIRNAGQMERLLGVQPVIVVPRLRSSRTRRHRRLGAALGLGVLAAAGAALWSLWERTVPERTGGLRRLAPVALRTARQ